MSTTGADSQTTFWTSLDPLPAQPLRRRFEGPVRAPPTLGPCRRDAVARLSGGATDSDADGLSF